MEKFKRLLRPIIWIALVVGIYIGLKHYGVIKTDENGIPEAVSTVVPAVYKGVKHSAVTVYSAFKNVDEDMKTVESIGPKGRPGEKREFKSNELSFRFYLGEKDVRDLTELLYWGGKLFFDQYSDQFMAEAVAMGDQEIMDKTQKYLTIAKTIIHVVGLSVTDYLTYEEFLDSTLKDREQLETYIDLLMAAKKAASLYTAGYTVEDWDVGLTFGKHIEVTMTNSVPVVAIADENGEYWIGIPKENYSTSSDEQLETLYAEDRKTNESIDLFVSLAAENTDYIREYIMTGEEAELNEISVSTDTLARLLEQLEVDDENGGIITGAASDVPVEERTIWSTENVGSPNRTLVFAPGEHIIHVRIFNPSVEEVDYYGENNGLPTSYSIGSTVKLGNDGYVIFDIYNCVEVQAQADENGMFLNLGVPTQTGE